MKKAALFSFLSLVTIAARAAVWEGFEMGSTLWNTSEEGGRISGAINRDVASEGAYAFGGRVEIPSLDGGPKAGFFFVNEVNFSQIDSFKFDLYNGTQSEWTVKLVLQTGNNWAWNEAGPWTLKPGWNRDLGVNLKEAVFAGQKLVSPEQVAKIQILLVPSQATQGALYLDNVRVSGPGAAALVPERIAGATEQLVDSFEGPTSEWKPNYGIGVRSEPDKEHASQGRQGLKIVAVSKDADQSGQFGIEREVDLSHVQSVVVDVYNPGPMALLSLALASGPNWDFAASPSVKLKTGWNPNVTFGLRSKTFKSAASKWKNNGAIPSNVVRRFGFEWTPGDTGRLRLSIDNLRFKEAGDLAVKTLAPAPPVTGVAQPLFAPGAGVPVKPRDDYSAARSAGFSRAWTLPGEGPALRLSWDASAKDQSGDFEWIDAPDLRGVRAITVDAYNPGSLSVDMALALQVGPASEWMESRPLRLAPGWNHGLVLSMDGPAFKSAASQWAYGASLPGRGPSTIRSAYWHVVAPAPGEGSLHLAKVSVLRSSLLPGDSVLLGIEGSTKAELRMEPVSWEIWDSGAGEGSFEKGITGWKGENSGSGGASVVRIEGGRPSAGANSLRVDFRGSGLDKAVAVYDGSAGPAIPDLSKVERIRFDIFNPGAPLAVGLAMVVGTGNTWIESMPVALRSGWNRDVTFDLTAPMWNGGGSASAPGATKTYAVFDSAWRGPGQVNKITITIQGARSGTVWLDSVRFGKAGSTSVTQHELDLGVRLSAGPMELKVSGLAVQRMAGGDYDLMPGASHVGLRGAGQELVASWSEALPPFDDELQVFTGRRGMNDGLGSYAKVAQDNWSALRWRGGLRGLQLQSFGALPYGPAPFSFGGQAIGGLRVKAAAENGSYVGGTLLHQRLGYDAGAAVMTDKVEQASQIMELDGEARLPFGFRVGGGVASSDWAASPLERMVLRDERGMPLVYSRPVTETPKALGVHGGWSGTYLDVTGKYTDVGDGFDNTLSDSLYLAKKIAAKLTLKLDAMPLFKVPDGAEGWRPNLRKGLSTSVEYLTHDNADLTYQSSTIQWAVANANDTTVGYALQVSSKKETYPVTSLRPVAGSTQSLGEKLRLHFKPWSGAVLETVGRWTNQDSGTSTFGDSVYGLGLTQAFLTHFTAGAQVAMYQSTAAATGISTNYSSSNYGARLGWQPTEQAKLDLWYGKMPLNGDMDLVWPTVDATLGLSLEASF